jgi:hypothetical protein
MYLTPESFTFRYRNVNDVKPDCSPGRAGGSPEALCLGAAMQAKGLVFSAQDAADKIAGALRRDRCRVLLARARACLEALDRELDPVVREEFERELGSTASDLQRFAKHASPRTVVRYEDDDGQEDKP